MVRIIGVKDARGTLAQRFWSKVDKNGPVPAHHADLGQCWLWTGSKSHAGYGHIRGEGSRWKQATHVALDIAGRPVPDGMKALHHCDNPVCIRESHLFHGTDSDNHADKARKGRSHRLRGEANAKSKLGNADVRCIRKSLANGIQGSALARLFGITRSLVSMIGSRQIWRHVA